MNFPFQSKLRQFRVVFLSLFIMNNIFISGNSLVSGSESSDLSTNLSNVIIEIAKLVIPNPEPEIIAPESISLAISNPNIYIGTSNRITPTILPANTTDKSIVWTTSDASIVDVTSGGIAIARHFGTATITATTIVSTVKQTITLTVIDYPDITDFNIDAKVFDDVVTSIQVGTSAKIRLSNITPSNGKATGLTFTSLHPSIATVNTDGVILGVQAGEATIEVTLGAKTKILTITILDDQPVIAPESLAIGGPNSGFVGRPFQLEPEFGETTPTDTQVTFKSSNQSFATVNDRGIVTPVNFATQNYSAYQPKTVTITAYANAKPSIIATRIITIDKVFPVSFTLASATAVQAGKAINLTPTFSPSDVTDKQIVYTSSDNAIATVSSAGDYGVVVGLQPGTVTITATSVMDATVQASRVIEITPLPFLSPEQLEQFMMFVRKGIGHFSLNFINGIFGFLTFYTWIPQGKKRFLLISVVVGSILATFAESLQFFAPGRTPTWDDVIYNVSGYLAAQLFMVALFWILATFIARQKSRKNMNEKYRRKSMKS